MIQMTYKMSVLTILLFSCLMTMGCEKAKMMFRKDNPFVAEEKVVKEESLIKRVESAELAKVLLKPEAHSLNIVRDPFAPIIQEKVKDDNVARTDEVETVGDLEFVGVVKMNQQHFALLRTYSAQGVFKKDDKIRNFTIDEIHSDYIVLKNDNKTIRIKRGDRNAQ